MCRSAGRASGSAVERWTHLRFQRVVDLTRTSCPIRPRLRLEWKNRAPKMTYSGHVSKRITISLKSKALWYKLQSALVRSIFVTRKAHADTVAAKFPSLP
jgi:hypothetical protein